ncbi:glycosyltransferase family 2 protein [Microbacterium lacticum]
MSPVPVVSIVVPVFDDASTDATAGIIEQVALSDPRVRLVHHDDNRTAFQARRTGILTARGEYVLFLDGDDELAPRAAEVARGRAQESGADVVGFGVDVVERDGRTGGTYERRRSRPTTGATAATCSPDCSPRGPRAGSAVAAPVPDEPPAGGVCAGTGRSGARTGQ